MKLIVGLGNPGTHYEKTRHNAGFMVLDALAGDEPWSESKKAKARYLKIVYEGQTAELLKPQTFMNESGRAVAYAMKKNGTSPSEILVIHDDVDIPLGEIRVQTGRSAAGHNGVASIIEIVGSKEFKRIRVGIRHTHAVSDTTRFVLGRFGLLEKRKLQEGLKQAAKAAHAWLAGG